MKLNIKKFYKDFAIIFLNILILFLLLNVFCWAILSWRDKMKKSPDKMGMFKYYSMQQVQTAYDDMSSEEIKQLNIETWGPGAVWTYWPRTEWIETERNGKYVNVSSAGFRLTKDQGEWPPNKDNFNIFLFGGSTTFCHGASDNETFASYLQDYLKNISSIKPIKVYNFGQGGFYSFQEGVLFEDLLRRNFVPDLAIFVDGLNDLAQSSSADPDKTSYQTEIIKNLLALTTEKEIFNIISKMPVVQFSKKMMEKAATFKKKSDEQQTEIYLDYEKRINNYLFNKKTIEIRAGIFEVKTLFIWQPIPYYNYDINKNIFGSQTSFSYFERGYSLLKEKASGFDNFLWLADLGAETEGQLYADTVHYAPRFNKIIAEKIFDYLVDNNFFGVLKTEIKNKN